MILQARATERELAQLRRAREPETWGVSAKELLELPTAANVELTVNDRSEVLAARRSDPYDLLHSAGGLSDEQHRASRRLFRDMATAAGAHDGPPTFSLERIDAGRGDPGAPTQAMIDASRRVKFVLTGAGPAAARVLVALNESMIAGEIRPWRAIVQLVTREKDRAAQAATVRQACESLVLVYRAIDERARAARAEGQPGELRPFSSFEPPET